MIYDGTCISLLKWRKVCFSRAIDTAAEVIKNGTMARAIKCCIEWISFHHTLHMWANSCMCFAHHFHQSAANFHLSLYFHPTLINHSSKPETVRVLICLQQCKMKNFHKTVNEFALTSNSISPQFLDQNACT